MNLFKVLFFSSSVFQFQTLCLAQDVFHNNLNIIEKNFELKQNEFNKKSIQSTFYPEFNLISGLAKERYSKNNFEIEQGGFLYLNSKFNLYNGNADSLSLKINELQNQVLKTGRDYEVSKIQNSVFELFASIEMLNEDNKLILNELKLNKEQSAMAEKKVNAGLTSTAELFDFQVKQDNLDNELKINEFKIKEKEAEIKSLFGNQSNLQNLRDFFFSQKSAAALQIPNMEENIIYKKLEQELSVSQTALKKSKSLHLPKLDFEAKAGKISPAPHFLKNKTEYEFSLTLTLPLFNGMNSSAEIQKSVADKQFNEQKLRHFIATFQTQATIEKNKIELKQQLSSSYEKILIKADKFRVQTIAEYKRGIKNSSDLISASDRVFELKRKINELKSEVFVSTFQFNNNF